MTGWIAFVLIGVSGAALLVAFGLARPLWSFAGLGLLLAGAGYAWQGKPAQLGAPVAARATPIPVNPGIVAFRTAIMPGSAASRAALAAADSNLRRGDASAAVRGLLDAIARRPRDAALWTGLGTAFAANDGRQVSPAAHYAFREAVRLAPDQPGPPFFLGLALIESGQIAEAKPAWQQALALTPADAPYRPDIVNGLATIDAFAAMAAGRPPAAP